MAFSAPIGESDFLSIRRQNATYVDKTAAITEITASPTKVYLFTRPRRFGKTTFLYTLRGFFQRPELGVGDTSPLFEGLDVWQSDAAREHHQRYPVLLLSFKDVQQREWPTARRMIQAVLSEAIRALEPALSHPALPISLRESLQAIQRPASEEGTLDNAIRLICEALHTATGERVVLLIDEYDSPLHAAWTHGYLPEALNLFRSMLGGALKENPYLHKAIITGILRVARESLFSGVNHLRVCSVLSGDFPDTFGFTQAEVERLAADAEVAGRLPELESWYNGYLIGGVRLYNPWSILNYLMKPGAGLIPHWLNTGGTAVVERLLDRFGTDLWPATEGLLAGGTLSTPLDEHLVFSDLDRRPEALWSLLLAAGYLKPVRTTWVEGELQAELTIPNREVRVSWRQLGARNLHDAMRGSAAVDRLTRAMLAGDERAFSADLRKLAANALSFHDTGGDWPERVWQAFVLGVLVHLDPGWEVRSNLEAGYGRADVLVRPRQPGRPGVVIEFKRIEEGEDVETTMKAAFAQIEDKDYAAPLRGVAAPILRIGVVFEGKKPHVKIERDSA